MGRLGGLILVLLAAGPAWACPTCKDAIAEDPAGRGFAVGMAVTVVGMLGVLFTLAGLMAVKIVRDERKAGAGQGGQGPA